MARYIDADDAIYELERIFPVDDFKKIIRAISRTPTADVVEVVRCKDCKHNDGSCCDYSAVYTRPNGYCQWGERRE